MFIELLSIWSSLNIKDLNIVLCVCVMYMNSKVCFLVRQASGTMSAARMVLVSVMDPWPIRLVTGN